MPVKLTDQAINKAGREAQKDGGRRGLACRGLRIRITPAGGRTRLLGARDKLGRARRFQLGAYPAMGIAEARRHRLNAPQVRQDGVDPIAERRRNLQFARAASHGASSGLCAQYLWGVGRNTEVLASRPTQDLHTPGNRKPRNAATRLFEAVCADSQVEVWVLECSTPTWTRLPIARHIGLKANVLTRYRPP
jgi:hypothetical protein